MSWINASRFTTWRARCFHEACRARDAERQFPTVNSAHMWATWHALNNDRGGHVVTVWCRIQDQSTWRPHSLRFSHLVHPIRDWSGWGWACLLCPVDGRGGPVWRDGHLTRKDMLDDWRAHDCDGRTAHD